MFFQVLHRHGINDLHLNESVKCIYLGFQEHEWKIKLLWSSGEVLFSKNWLKFVKAANIAEGDVLAIHENENAFKYGVCVYHALINNSNGFHEGIIFSTGNALVYNTFEIFSHSFHILHIADILHIPATKIFKVINSDVLEEGELVRTTSFLKVQSATTWNVLYS